MTDFKLTFADLRAANLARLPLFKNGRGEPAHRDPLGFDWPLSTWCNAVLGELGEAANLIKKIERGDFTLDQARAALADELADVVTYLDILAFRAGVDLGAATVSKWNRVSMRIDCRLRLGSAGLDANGDWPVGALLRYDSGPTALFMVTYVSRRHGGSETRYYGVHCMGGLHGAYHYDCVLAGNTSWETWASHADSRRHTKSLFDGSIVGTVED